MRKRVTALTALYLTTQFAFMGTAHAQQSCNYPVGTFDQVYCMSKVTLQADAEMNVSYQKLLKKLSAANQQVLRQTQRAWMTRRDQDCVDGYMVYMDCSQNMTVSRLNFLNDRLRECNSSGCQPSKLR